MTYAYEHEIAKPAQVLKRKAIDILDEVSDLNKLYRDSREEEEYL